MGISTRPLRSFRPVCLESPCGSAIFQFQEGPAGSEGTKGARIGQGTLCSSGTVASKCQAGQETSRREATKTRPSGSFRATCSRAQASPFRASRAEEKVMNSRDLFCFV